MVNSFIFLGLIIFFLFLNFILILSICNFLIRMANSLSKFRDEIESYYYIQNKPAQKQNNQESGLVDL